MQTITMKLPREHERQFIFLILSILLILSFYFLDRIKFFILNQQLADASRLAIRLHL